MFVLSLLFVSIASAETPVWRSGWYSQPPLQFSARQGDVETVTGLDVQLIRAITREAGHLLRLEEIPWERHQQLLKSGDCELAFGAPWTAEREKFLRFSAPYRQEENALYVRIRDRTPEGTERPAKYTRVFDTLFGFFDAVGLAAFTVTGVRVAVQMQCDPLWLWGPLLAALTGAGGGVLRDIVRADPDISALKRGLYAEVALVWGLLLSLFLGAQIRHISMDQVRNGILVALLGTLITRLIILYRGWENPLQFNSRRTSTFRR